MNIVIAPDSFKGSLSAIEASRAIEKGIRKVSKSFNVNLVPLGDGGEGTMRVLVNNTNGETRKAWVTDPNDKKIKAEYGILGDKRTCVIEMACASGLNLVPEKELSPLEATSYGTGELIKHALDEGFRSFILTIGGSATNDGGAGMLQALGAKLLDDKNREISFGGGSLANINEILLNNFDSRIKDSEFIVASDVTNPLLGIDGASNVFAEQKGADHLQIEILENNLAHWADKVFEATNMKIHYLPGAGAAGGIGGAFQAFFPHQFRSGVDLILEYVQMEELLENADLLITGEGKIDEQTMNGKTAFGVAKLAHSRNVPVIVLAGATGEGIEGLYNYSVISINSIINSPMSLEEAVRQAESLLSKTTEQILRTFTYKYNNENLLHEV